MKLKQLVSEIQQCTHCQPQLPLGARPLMQAGYSAEIIVIGQAPGSRAHESGLPWDDASGRRLREWLGVQEEVFYDKEALALMPMGFCYPGTGKTGDLPPRPECAPKWHGPLLEHLTNIQLTILIGRYAIDAYTQTRYRTLTQAVKDYESLLPNTIVLPHPSPRNNRWLSKNRWFEEETIPRLRGRVNQLLK